MTKMTAREIRDWDLYADWCVSIGAEPLPSSHGAIEQFLEEFPAAPGSQERRRRAILKRNTLNGSPLPTPNTGASVSPAMRVGEEWAGVGRALAQTPRYGYPVNAAQVVRGRRDAFILVLVGVLGLTRSEVINLAASDIDATGDVRVLGQAIPCSEPARECPACAVTRWVRIGTVLFPHHDLAVAIAVSATHVNEDEHDCQLHVDEPWPDTAPIIPSINQRGVPHYEQLSRRSISATMARRQALGPVTEIKHFEARADNPLANATSREVADVQDEVLDRIDALIALTEDLWTEVTKPLDLARVAGL